MPRFYIFPTKHPLCRVSAGNGTGGGALDKAGRDCYHKSRKSAVTSGWLSVSANNYNADRSVAAGRSARFYGQVYNPPCVGSRSGAALLTKFWRTAIIKTERALPRVVSLSKSCISKFYADRLAATERSARFYGQCQGQNDHAH